MLYNESVPAHILLAFYTADHYMTYGSVSAKVPHTPTIHCLGRARPSDTLCRTEGSRTGGGTGTFDGADTSKMLNAIRNSWPQRSGSYCGIETAEGALTLRTL